MTVICNTDSVTVIPEKPEGYSISFSESGTKISFNGIEIEETGDTLSCFYPIYEMARGINCEVTENQVKHKDGYVFK